MVNWGPFAEAPATEDSLAHCWMRLLGVYEFYLHSAVEAAILSKPPVVVDVGASTGYYSIGMAYRLPSSRHFAFEMQEKERELLGETVHSHLKNWTILLEVHDWHAPGAGEEIYERFQKTHKIETIRSQTAGQKEFVSIVPWPLNIYCGRVLNRICEEGRGESGMRFFSMLPKNRS